MEGILTGVGEPPAVDAATVVLVRDAPGGPECLMLRKTKGQAFGGLWVFPGGRVEPVDGEGLDGARRGGGAGGEGGDRAAARPRRSGGVRPLAPSAGGAAAVRHVVLPRPAPRGRGRRDRRWRRDRRPRVDHPDGGARPAPGRGDRGGAADVGDTPAAGRAGRRGCGARRRERGRCRALRHPRGLRRRGAGGPVGPGRGVRVPRPSRAGGPAPPAHGPRRLEVRTHRVRGPARNPRAALPAWWPWTTT